MSNSFKSIWQSILPKFNFFQSDFYQSPFQQLHSSPMSFLFFVQNYKALLIYNKKYVLPEKSNFVYFRFLTLPLQNETELRYCRFGLLKYQLRRLASFLVQLLCISNKIKMKQSCFNFKKSFAKAICLFLWQIKLNQTNSTCYPKTEKKIDDKFV